MGLVTLLQAQDFLLLYGIHLLKLLTIDHLVSVTIDGFDFDIENNLGTGYTSLADEWELLPILGSKYYYISAAPQCVYPDT